jgi:serine/threonine-protein kinase HipA
MPAADTAGDRRVVQLYGRRIGTLRRQGGGVEFSYAPELLARPPARFHHPLSLSLPFRAAPFAEAGAGPFFAGLLPDGMPARRQLGRELQVDATDDFGMLAALGRDCAGAVTLLPADQADSPGSRLEAEPHRLGEAELAQRIRDLPARPLFVDPDGEVQLSLAGVHDKAAVLLVRAADGSEQVALPRHGAPSSHILKVDIAGLKDSARVEHFCLQLAGRAGLQVPHAEIRTAEDQSYLLLQRYDRSQVVTPGQAPSWRRLHQEDFCQATGQYPAQKYEKRGGLDAQRCMALLGAVQQPARDRIEFLRRLLFNYLIGNPDAHAKNYALVYRPHGVQLAPFYDLNCAAAYRSQFKEQRPQLAMSVGGQRNPDLLTAENWAAFAVSIGVPAAYVRRTLVQMAKQLPAFAQALFAELSGTVAASPLLPLVVEDLTRRCATAVALLDRKS